MVDDGAGSIVDDARFYPKLEDLLKALQDEGVMNERDEACLIEYKNIGQLVTTLYKSWKKIGSAEMTHGLVLCIVLMKTMDSY